MNEFELPAAVKLWLHTPVQPHSVQQTAAENDSPHLLDVAAVVVTLSPHKMGAGQRSVPLLLNPGAHTHTNAEGVWQHTRPCEKTRTHTAEGDLRRRSMSGVTMHDPLRGERGASLVSCLHSL